MFNYHFNAEKCNKVSDDLTDRIKSDIGSVNNRMQFMSILAQCFE